jgi:putative tryptophan/tyrosine transport system substrate-binding protein
MKRREFVMLVAGAATALPFATRAQQEPRPRVVGVLWGASENTANRVRLDAFRQAMAGLHWDEGRNLTLDVRWGNGDVQKVREQAKELLAVRPDVILSIGSYATGALRDTTHSVPIVFIAVPDPVAAGYVANLAHPGGNVTGFVLLEYGVSGKWPGLLKQIAPGIKRLAVLRDPTIAGGIGQLALIEAAASPLGLEVIPFGMADRAEIERSIAAFASSPDGGMIVTASTQSFTYGDFLIELAARHRLPASWSIRSFVERGGLLSYGPDPVEPSRKAAGYVDRILNGEKPADLPVQTPTKYELTINLKTAKALGLSVPESLLASADATVE